MCENCLNLKHVAKFCCKASCCDVSGCNEKHYTMLHNLQNKVRQNTQVKTGQSNCCPVVDLGDKCNWVSLQIVPVIVGTNHMHVKTYARLMT